MGMPSTVMYPEPAGLELTVMGMMGAGVTVNVAYAELPDESEIVILCSPIVEAGIVKFVPVNSPFVLLLVVPLILTETP